MKNRFVTLALAGMLTAAVPVSLFAAQMLELGVMEQVDEQVNVNIDNRTVLVTGAQGETLEVVSLTGKRVMTVAIDSPAQRIELNIPKGCYILKVGKVVRKITVR